MPKEMVNNGKNANFYTEKKLIPVKRENWISFKYSIFALLLNILLINASYDDLN